MIRPCKTCQGWGFVKNENKITCQVCPDCRYGDILIEDRKSGVDALCIQKYGKTFDEMVRR